MNDSQKQTLLLDLAPNRRNETEMKPPRLAGATVELHALVPINHPAASKTTMEASTIFNKSIFGQMVKRIFGDTKSKTEVVEDGIDTQGR